MRIRGARTSMCPASLTALWRSASSSSKASPPPSMNSAAFSSASAISRGLAPAVLIVGLVMMTSGCFNPFYIDRAQPRQNHVPVVEVFPPPPASPIEVSLGGCAQTELEVVSIEDADGDTLEVRYDLVRTVNGTEGKRSQLLPFPPLVPEADGTYIAEIGDIELTSAIGNLGLTIEDDTQLVELRVFDHGFFFDGNGTPVPNDDGGVFFMSWMVSIGQCQ